MQPQLQPGSLSSGNLVSNFKPLGYNRHYIGRHNVSPRRATSDISAPGAYDSATIRPLGRDAPATPAPHPDTDIHSTPRLRSVIYMVDHMCEPICQSRFASCGSNRALQGGSRVPLTLVQWCRRPIVLITQMRIHFRVR